MSEIKPALARVARALRRRPVRVAQALVTLAGVAGVALEPQAAEAILTIAGLLLTGTVGGEVVQRKRRRHAPTEGEPVVGELPDEPGL